MTAKKKTEAKKLKPIAKRKQLAIWILEALTKEAPLDNLAIAKALWSKHNNKIRSDERFTFTWQYDMRWALTDLKQKGAVVRKPAGFVLGPKSKEIRSEYLGLEK